MAELRSVDPRSLIPNPDNPRTTRVPKEMEQQLIASIKAIGILQPPVVREIDGQLVIRAGERRRNAAIAAGLEQIDVYILVGNEEIDAMAAVSENVVRVGMNPVDIWRGIDKLEQQNWNEEAIANALALPSRTVRKLKLLGKLHPPMLDAMAKGSMPSEEQLRTIANAPVEDQAQVWKALKPKKGHDVVWWEIARALSKPRLPFSAARFDDKLAEEFGVRWTEDLFAPAGAENRYTTNAEGFFGAQQAWMTANLPPNGTILPISEHGSPTLPKGAEHVYGKPNKSDKIGHYVNPRSGEIETVTYRLPRPKTGPKASKGKTGTETPDDTDTVVKRRPDVTQKGLAMIGDFRTDALHQALDMETIPNETLIGLLILGLAADNVSVQTNEGYNRGNRAAIAAQIGEGGVLTTDTATLNTAARAMLKLVLSCRDNMTNSGVSSRIAGESLGAATYLPTMATEEFLSCLSRQALEHNAATNGAKIEVRVKDTRSAMVKHFTDKTWVYPGAAFTLSDAERAEFSTEHRHWVNGEDDDGEADDTARGHEPSVTDDEDDSQPYPDAAE